MQRGGSSNGAGATGAFVARCAITPLSRSKGGKGVRSGSEGCNKGVGNNKVGTVSIESGGGAEGTASSDGTGGDEGIDGNDIE